LIYWLKTFLVCVHRQREDGTGAAIVTEMASKAGRAHNANYDKLRAIGIVLVVLGHTLGISRGVELYIYSCHMPLFFFLSGLMLTPARLGLGLPDAIRHYTSRLLVPYFLFSLITWIPWALVTRHRGADATLGIPAWKPLIGTFYGVGVDGWLQHNAVLWFLPCLFLVHLLFHQLSRYFRGIQFLGGVATCAALGYGLATILPVRLPWCGEAALIAIPFYAAGNWLSRHHQGLPQPSIGTAIGLLGLLVLQYGSIVLNGRVDINFLSLENPLLFYLGAFSGIGALVGLVVFMPGHPLYARVADGSMLTFTLHRPLFSVFSGVGLLIATDMQAFKVSVWGSLAYAVGAICVATLLWPWVRRYLPALAGGR